MSAQEMLVIKRGYDFSKWLLNHTGKFPRSYRFSVASKIENAILDFIEMTSVANTRRDKLPLLKQADEALVLLVGVAVGEVRIVVLATPAVGQLQGLLARAEILRDEVAEATLEAV